jgi:hypothetical protein
VLLVGLGAAALMGTAAAPAVADGGGASPVRSAATTGAAVHPLTSSNPTNPYFGGEQGTPADGVASIGSTFLVPKVSCPANATGLLVGDSFSDTNDQTQAEGLLVAQCVSGAPSYGLVADTFGGGQQDVFSGVSPGDLIIISDYATSSNTVATVTDETSGVTESSQDGTGDASGAPSEQFDSGIFNFGPVPKFSALTFKEVQVNGEHLAQTDPTAIDLENQTDRQVVTTPPSSPNGSKFTLTYKHEN